MSNESSLENRLRNLEERLKLLEDERAIRQLINSYGPAVDSGNSAAAADLWTDNGVYDYKMSVNEQVVAQQLDKQGIADMLEARLHQTLIHEGAAHTLGPAYIEIRGDKAIATNYSVIFRRIGMSVTVYRVAANRWELSRTAAGWRADKRVNRLLDGSAETRELLAAATMV
jgi:hypothetical protein